MVDARDDLLDDVGRVRPVRPRRSSRHVHGETPRLEWVREGQGGGLHADHRSDPQPQPFALGQHLAVAELVMRPGRVVRRVLAVLLAATTLPLLSASTSSAATSFTFYGSGYGHGLGLSQWGAYGLAQKGWSYQRILTHFYGGTTVKPSPYNPSPLRIGLAQEIRGTHLSPTQGSVKLTLGSPKGKVIGRPFNVGETWRVLVDRSGKFKVLDNTGKAVGRHLWGSGRTNIYALFSGTGKVHIPESGHTYNRGYIEFNIYHSGGCGRLGYCERMIMLLRRQPKQRRPE